MPAKTVSIKESMFKLMLDRGISPSNAINLGIRICAKGGLDGMRSEIRRDFEIHLENKEMEIGHLKDKIKRLERQLEKYWKKEVKDQMRKVGIKVTKKPHHGRKVVK